MKKVLLSAGALVALSLGFAPSVRAQDVKSGQAVFAQCRACHQVGPKARNLVGPELNGLFGRKAGSVIGYNYSSANKNSGITWTEETFAKYIANPRAVVPGTKMAFAGVKDPRKVADLTAYLEQFDEKGNIQPQAAQKPAAAAK